MNVNLITSPVQTNKQQTVQKRYHVSEIQCNSQPVALALILAQTNLILSQSEDLCCCIGKMLLHSMLQQRQ